MQTGPLSLFITENNVINLMQVSAAYWLSPDYVSNGAKKTLKVILVGETINDDQDPGFRFDDEDGDEFIQAMIDCHELHHSRTK